MEDRSPLEDRCHLELELLHAAGVRLVAVRAPDGSPEGCLAADEALYTTERALREAPLPHAPACTCFYAPRAWEDWEPASGRGGLPEESLLVLAS